MGLSTVQAMPFSKLPSAFSTPSSSHSPLLLNPSLPLRQTQVTPSLALSPRSISLRNVLPRATPSEETSSGASPVFYEKRDGAVVIEDVKPDDDKNSFKGTEDKENVMVSSEAEEKEKELPVEEQGLSLDFLDKLNIKFDADDTGSVVLYGGGALVALWLTSAVIGAIDSIPLFPKLLEVVGLGYTVWFTSRYMLFKKNRDELIAKIEELKEQVLGSEDK